MKNVFSRPFTKREKAYLMILAVLLLVAAYIYLVYLPVGQRTETASRSIARTNIALEQEQLLGQQRIRMSDALEKLKAEAGDEVVAIPAFDNAQALVAELDEILSLAASYDVVFQPVTVEAGLVRRHLQINFNCADYDRASAVLEGLNQSAYRNEISAVSLTPAENRRGGDIMLGSLHVSVSLTYFEYNEAPGA